VAYTGDRPAFDQTRFYAGGGGQPSDSGSITIDNMETITVTSVEAGEGDVIWHHLATPVKGNPVVVIQNRGSGDSIQHHWLILVSPCSVNMSGGLSQLILARRATHNDKPDKRTILHSCPAL